MREIMNLVVDGEINTKQQAAALVAEEAAEMAQLCGKSADEWREILLANIGYCTGYYDNATADRIMELFETEHPIFGKTHPSPEEAFRLGMALGEAAKKKSEERDEPHL
jgi:hypothetical protein